MDKPDRTTPNGRTGAAASNAMEPATPPALRPWQKPSFERIPLNEALSSLRPGMTDASVGYS
jgi:hypothetical protein